MESVDICKQYLSLEYLGYLVQYIGDYLGELSKVDYACGFIITERIGILIIKEEDFNRARTDIPSIVLIQFRRKYILEEIQPSDSANINFIKENNYLGLTGKGVLIGIIDTGIDYLNREFWYEDDSSRILAIWDQSIEENDTEVYIGKVYYREKINEAIVASKKGENPYDIVPSRDEIGHGTKIAGIVGARGYEEDIQGIAQDSEFVVVKLAQSSAFIHELSRNGINNVPVYNDAEVFAAMEYLKRMREKENKPMVIFLGVGSTEGVNEGNGLLSRYIDRTSRYAPLAVITGTGNEGDSEGHFTDYIYNAGGKKIAELTIPKVMDSFNLKIWIVKPNKMSVNIISPSGEQSREIKSKIEQVQKIKYIFENTELIVTYYVPEAITGNELINLQFKSIKPGIWKFELIGQYIVDGRFDIWLPPKITLPEGVKFLSSNPENTITNPGLSTQIITVAYYDSSNDSIVSSSGQGFNISNKKLIKPNIAAPGVNIITTGVNGGKFIVSGSSVAAAIVSGICALLFQWGVIDENDRYMNSSRVRGYLVDGAIRDSQYKYPNKNWGNGKVDLKGVFKAISGSRFSNNEKYYEYYIGNLFVRIPRRFAKKG